MLYILECMLFCFSNGLGWNSRTPLETTGELMTLKDISVGLLGWFIVVLAIFIIIYTVRYFYNKHKNCEVSGDNQASLIKAKNNYFSGYLYLLECMFLCILFFRNKANRVMYTTGQKPKSKEIAYCISAWIYLALMVTWIVLICVF